MTASPPGAAIDPCVAGILVGGRSRRMGVDKAALKLPDGSTYLEHACKIAAAVAREVVLLGACDDPPSQVARVLPDLLPDGGPMVGLYSLLGHAKNRWALMLACDMPLLTPDTLARLLAAPRDGDIVAFVRSDDVQPRHAHDAPARPTPSTACGPRLHACCALYHPRLLPRVRALLEEEDRSLQSLAGTAIVTTLTPTSEETRSLENVNTPDDLKRLGLR